MDAFPITTAAIDIVSTGLSIALLLVSGPNRLIGLIRLYGPSGVLLFIFGSQTTWRLEAQVLRHIDRDGNLIDDSAQAFKRTVSDECTVISVAVGLLLLDCLSLDLYAIGSSGCPNQHHSALFGLAERNTLGSSRGYCL